MNLVKPPPPSVSARSTPNIDTGPVPDRPSSHNAKPAEKKRRIQSKRCFGEESSSLIEQFRFGQKWNFVFAYTGLGSPVVPACRLLCTTNMPESKLHGMLKIHLKIRLDLNNKSDELNWPNTGYQPLSRWGRLTGPSIRGDCIKLPWF